VNCDCGFETNRDVMAEHAGWCSSLRTLSEDTIEAFLLEHGLAPDAGILYVKDCPGKYWDVARKGEFEYSAAIAIVDGEIGIFEADPDGEYELEHVSGDIWARMRRIA